MTQVTKRRYHAPFSRHAMTESSGLVAHTVRQLGPAIIIEKCCQASLVRQDENDKTLPVGLEIMRQSGACESLQAACDGLEIFVRNDMVLDNGGQTTVHSPQHLLVL